MNKTTIEKYGYDTFFITQIDQLNESDKNLIPGRILEVHREQYVIITEHGEKPAKLKGSLYYNDNQLIAYPAIGDFVLVKNNPLGVDIIYNVLERKSKFSRLDSHYDKEQVVATNFDYVFIMTSLNHDFNIKKMERYLATTWQSGGLPVIILTKTDLCTNLSFYEEQLERVALGVPILSISSHTGEGIERLQKYMQPTKTIVFLGSSGVGKSSLINVMAGSHIMKVNDIREDDSKGRHTTTHRQLIMLENGTMVIDTPGMRELGMWDVSEGIGATYSDIEALATQCKFNDCGHRLEVSCAIRAAIESGELAAERWDNYKKLQKEMKYARSKENQKIRMAEKSKQKNCAKFRKQIQRGD